MKTLRHAASACLVTALLAGCQVQPPRDATATTLSSADAQQPTIHLYMQDDSTAEGSITHIARQTPLIKAIKHALPEATILPEPGIEMDQPVSVWAEKASTDQYLTLLGNAANLSIIHKAGVVKIKAVDRWSFALPESHHQAALGIISKTSPNATTALLSSSDDFVTLLVTAPPTELAPIKEAVFQLSGQVALDTTFKGE